MSVRELVPLSGFGTCVMDLAKKRGMRSQAAVIRALRMVGYRVPERTFANYLYGRTVVDPALPHRLVDAMCLNKGETRQLAWWYTFGQPPRTRRSGAREEGAADAERAV